LDVLLDTSVLIEAERNRDSKLPDGELALSAVCVTEYWKGVERADGLARRRAREAFFEAAFGGLPVLAFDGELARSAARIWAELRRAGATIPPLDLLVATTAVEHGLSLATFDRRHFGRIEGLELIDVYG
jgi:predicted nucleic acid-binding protein